MAHIARLSNLYMYNLIIFKLKTYIVPLYSVYVLCLYHRKKIKSGAREFSFIPNQG